MTSLPRRREGTESFENLEDLGGHVRIWWQHQITVNNKSPRPGRQVEDKPERWYQVDPSPLLPLVVGTGCAEGSSLCSGVPGGPLTRTAVNKAKRAAKDGHPGLRSASTGDVGAQTAPHKHEPGGRYPPDSALLTEKHPSGNPRRVERPAKGWAESSRKQRNTPPFLSLEGLGSESRGRVKDARA